MRPKSGLPKRKALRAMPQFEFGFRNNPATEAYRHPQLSGLASDKRGEVTVTSLFAGCGGLDLGMLGGFTYRSELYEALPFRIVAAYDNDRKAVATYKLNLSPDIWELDLTVARMADLPNSDLLIGGFPCQDFSSSGPKLGLEGSRGRLYRVMVRYMEHHRPKVVVAENVPHLLKMKKGAMIEEVLSEFEEVGYDFKVWNLHCPSYGLPQNRNRLFLVGVRRDLQGEPAMPTPLFAGRHRPVEWAIDDLSAVADETIPNQSQYFVATKATAGAGQGDQVNKKGSVAYCVRANPKARVHFHYDLDRRLTVRECARLQSFPDEFVFPHASGPNIMQIGNAVPPIIAHQVGRSLSDYFSGLERGRSSERRSRSRPSLQLAFRITD